MYRTECFIFLLSALLSALLLLENLKLNRFVLFCIMFLHLFNFSFYTELVIANVHSFIVTDPIQFTRFCVVCHV